MDPQRKIRNLAKNIVSTIPGKQTQHNQQSNQGIASLIVMISVLTIMVLFCCFAAPGIRSICKRYIFKSCTIDDPSTDNVYTRYGYAGYDTRDEINEVKEFKNKLRASKSQDDQS